MYIDYTYAISHAWGTLSSHLSLIIVIFVPTQTRQISKKKGDNLFQFMLFIIAN